MAGKHGQSAELSWTRLSYPVSYVQGLTSSFILQLSESSRLTPVYVQGHSPDELPGCQQACQETQDSHKKKLASAEACLLQAGSSALLSDTSSHTWPQPLWAARPDQTGSAGSSS